MKKKPSVFNTHMRVRMSQKLWIKRNKGEYTETGRLDAIINFYKKHHPEVNESSRGHPEVDQEEGNQTLISNI